MSESEMRTEVSNLLGGLEIGPGMVTFITERIMEMASEYASERASDEAAWSVREYEERQ